MFYTSAFPHFMIIYASNGGTEVKTRSYRGLACNPGIGKIALRIPIKGVFHIPMRRQDVSRSEIRVVEVEYVLELGTLRQSSSVTFNQRVGPKNSRVR